MKKSGIRVGFSVIPFLLCLLLSVASCPVSVLGAGTPGDGEYCVSADMTGGSGKASITSPMVMKVKDGQAYACLTWSSANYDYMIVDGERFENLSEEGQYSTFEIPITVWDQKMEVIADTLAMGDPVEITYQLTFYSDSIGDKSQLPQEAAKRVLIVAMVIIVGGWFLNRWIKKRYGE